MAEDPTGSEVPEGRLLRAKEHVGTLVTSPLFAVVGVVAAVAQILDYLQDEKARLVGLAVAALAAAVCTTTAWRHRRSLKDRLASVGWPGYVVYGSALVGTLSVMAAAVAVALPGRPETGGAGSPTTSIASATMVPPSPSRRTPSPQAATSPSPSVPPLADGVTCGSALTDKVTITSVYAADGGVDLGDDMVVAMTVDEAPTDGATYWLMVYADDVPRNLHLVWQKLAPGDTVARHTVKAGVGSHRQIYVAQSSPSSEAWFEENLSRDGDYSWDGNRVDLPSGARKVSNICDATRKR